MRHVHLEGLAICSAALLSALGLFSVGCAEGAQATDDDGGSAAEGGAGGGGGGSTGAGGNNRPPSSSFTQMATTWSVPEAGWVDGFHSVANQSSFQHWSTFDIDGDGAVELVQTADPTTQEVLGGIANPHWRVFENSGDGFSMTHTAWPVPAAVGSEGFHSTAYFSSFTQWSTFDIDGDGQPELVVTTDPQTGYVFGGSSNPHWRVYNNSGVGFDEGFLEWSVPDASWTEGFMGPNGQTSFANWTTFDIDGDEAPELVLTSDPQTGAVFGLGSEPQWHVYDNEGNGFSDGYIPWRVPTSPSTDGYNVAASAGSFDKWSTFDVDGDGAAELVVTSDPATGYAFGAGTDPQWHVYDNMGNSFSEGYIPWGLPQAMWSEGFNSPASTSSTQRWSTVDIDGDGAPELVHTSDPATTNVWGGGSTPHWRVFDNTGSGFTVIHNEWKVPTAPWLEGFYSFANQSNYYHWTVIDIDGDGYPDLVSTADPAASTVWRDGGAVWKVYRGQM